MCALCIVSAVCSERTFLQRKKKQLRMSCSKNGFRILELQFGNIGICKKFYFFSFLYHIMLHGLYASQKQDKYNRETSSEKIVMCACSEANNPQGQDSLDSDNPSHTSTSTPTPCIMSPIKFYVKKVSNHPHVPRAKRFRGGSRSPTANPDVLGLSLELAVHNYHDPWRMSSEI